MKRRQISLYSYVVKCPGCETVIDMRCVPRSGEGDAPWDVIYTCAGCGLQYALIDRPMYITVEVASGETAEDITGVFASKSDKQILRILRRTDAIAAVKQARAAALRWVLDEINDGVPVYGPSIVHRFAPAGHLDGVLSERERLRNLIEKELQQ